MSDILDDLKMMADHCDQENDDEPCDLGMLLIRAIAEIRNLRQQPVGEVDAVDGIPVPTGHAEADRLIGRLMSSDPDYDDCADAAALIQREIKGPDGFDTWREAALAERIKRTQQPVSAAEVPMPPKCHPLHKLGQRLAELLDENQWAECERLLLEGWKHEQKPSAAEVPMPEPIGRLYFGGVSCGERDEWEFDADQGVCDRINESATEESRQRVYLHRDVLSYGDAREAAGYARGLAEERERCAVAAWTHYMNTCKRNGIGPDVYPQWCCAAALRGEVKP